MRNIRNIFFALITISLMACNTEEQPLQQHTEKPDYALVIHGGAGYIVKGRYNDKQEKEYIDKLSQALSLGDSLLKNGVKAVDVVEQVVMLMENSPLFNAGKGAVFTAAGENEMDASIMDGSKLNAGAVAGVKTIKNPIRAARMVMDSSKHVLLSGEGAQQFAAAKGIEIVDPDYFYSEKAWKSLQNALESEKKKEKMGTVGAVALDQYGNLAAATSTGGMTNKMKGRIGDSPIIGAGTYADNESCAVSGTGHGEYFIVNAVAFHISALMKYKGMSLQEAADHVVNGILKEQDAGGGVIAVDYNGHVAMPFNTPGMFRGYIKAGDEMVVKLYGEDSD